MTEVPNLTTVDELHALVEAFRADGQVPVFSSEEDGTWIYSTAAPTDEAEASGLSPLKAIVPTDVFDAWRDRIGVAR